MYSVTIKGFPTKKAAQTFVDWYEGSGEQMISEWWEIHMDSNNSPLVDMKSIKKTKDGIEFSVKCGGAT